MSCTRTLNNWAVITEHKLHMTEVPIKERYSISKKETFSFSSPLLLYVWLYRQISPAPFSFSELLSTSKTKHAKTVVDEISQRTLRQKCFQFESWNDTFMAILGTQHSRQLLLRSLKKKMYIMNINKRYIAVVDTLKKSSFSIFLFDQL